MKITLSFEESISSDVSIMVDALRASTTITVALDKFQKVIPCFTLEEALKLKEKIGGIAAGERNGAKIDGFDIGNSPSLITKLKTDNNLLILTTSNGTRILENMNSNALVGSMINAKSAALKSIEIAYEFARAIESEDIIRIILFGSVARRDDKEESDIDILIVTPSREKINSIVDDEVFNINAKYLEVVSAHIMTEEFYNRTKDYSFLTSVREEGVLLVGDY